MTTQKMSLYRFDWQLLRVRLNFTTIDSTSQSLTTLMEYLEKPEEDYDTRDNKLWRVLNLLNATLMGQNGQKKRVTTDEQLARIGVKDGLVRKLRDKVAEEYHANKIHNFKWDEEIEVERLRNAHKGELEEVLDSLLKRSKFATEKKKMDVYRTRPELVKYIVLLKNEVKKR